MRWPYALSIGIVLTVAALGIKAAALARPEPTEDRGAYLDELAGRLTQAGFAVGIDRRVFVTAQRGACRIKVRDLPPMGVEQRAFERLGAAFGPTRYAWHGEWRTAPPKFMPLMRYYLQRELARIGWTIPRRSIAAVSGRAACANVPAALFDIAIVQR